MGLVRFHPCRLEFSGLYWKVLFFRLGFVLV